MASVKSPKITNYFPPSPKSDDCLKIEKEIKDKIEKIPETTSVTDVKDSLSTSSVIITPQSSPAKEETQTPVQSQETKTEPKKNSPSCKKGLSEELKKEEGNNPQVPPKSKRKGRRRKNKSAVQKQGENDGSQVAAKPVNKKSTVPELRDTLVTDYFAVRRSDRRNKGELEKEKEKDLQYKILNGIEDGLKVEDLGEKGRGVVATKLFSRGDFVVEYAGDLINLTEAKKREDKYSKDHSKGCYMYYFNFKNKKYCIDATEETGKLGRLLNHSKTSGNCHTKLVDVNGSPYLILVASRDISVGEELLYDYGDRSKSSLDSHPWLKS